MPFLYRIIESLMLVFALSIDSLLSGFAYGTSKIKMSTLSIIVITTISTLFLFISMLFGSMFNSYINTTVTRIITFCILFTIGIVKVFDSAFKTYIKRQLRKCKFSLLNTNFLLNIYVNTIEADKDLSKELSVKEATYLATALSLDSLIVGFGIGCADIRYIEVLVCSLIVGFLLIIIGEYLGTKVAQSLSINLSWIGGIIFIVLAFLRI